MLQNYHQIWMHPCIRSSFITIFAVFFCGCLFSCLCISFVFRCVIFLCKNGRTPQKSRFQIVNGKGAMYTIATPTGKVFGHVFPGTASSAKPDECLKDTAVRHGRSSAFGSDGFHWKDFFDPCPIQCQDFPVIYAE